MWNTLDSFYQSKEWKRFRKVILSDRLPICFHCGEAFKEEDTIVVHHKEELTLGNVNDYMISLNPDNVELVHDKCHNKIHKRAGYGRYKKTLGRGIYIVYGPPLAGKTSYVLENKDRRDIVVDMDRLYQAITLLPLYDKPEELKYNVMFIRDSIIDNIKTKYGKFNSAWIIGGYADKYKRELLQRELGAELILLKPDKKELYRRLEEITDERKNKKDFWKSLIDNWFEEYFE
ncbi:HNH endonuclease [Clostridium perfringens]|nr:HNH endonuclease [Clostridium perfringens]